MLGSFPLRAKPSIACSRTRQAAQCPVGVNIITNPVEIVIAFDGWMVGVNQDHLMPFLPTVFADPIAIQYP